MIRKRSAFTTIELLVVIGIILILAGMLFIGGRAIMGRSRTNATRTTLGNLANMLAELDAKTRAVAELDEIYSNASPVANPLPAPGNVSRDAYPANDDRYESQAVILTQTIMGNLRAVPLNRTAIENLPADQLLSGPGNTGDFAGFPLAVAPGAGPGDPIRLDPPILADAWGNPIIFVPSQGLSQVTFEDHGSEPHVVTSTGTLEPTDPVPAGVRPFFASAGEDGNFQTGDDNIYSFEN